MLRAAKDASHVIAPHCFRPKSTDDFHLSEMCCFSIREPAAKECVPWLVQMGTIKDGAANPDMWYQLWMWLLH